MAIRNRSLLFNCVFIPALLLLALNDHYLKWTYHNTLTGKLSDVAGLIVLPMFLLFLLPRLKSFALWLSAVFFIFWKLPISDSFIHYYNRIALIPIMRTVDYTDLIALTVLPFVWLVINNLSRLKFPPIARLSIHPMFVLIPCSFVLMATSPPLSYYMNSGGDVHIGKAYKMKLTEDQIVNKLRQQGYTVTYYIRPDTSSLGRRINFYLIENIRLPDDSHPIKSVEIKFMNGFLLVNNVHLDGPPDLSDWRKLRRYSKHYRKLINEGIIEELK